MAVYAGPEIFTNGLVLALDAGNTQSYPGSGTTWTDLISAGQQATLQGTSTFTFEWTLRTSGTASILNSLTYGNSLYVAGGASGVLNTSTDAINWTLRTSGVVGSTDIVNGITFGNNLYVAGGGTAGTIFMSSSTDTISWTLRTVSGANPQFSAPFALTFANNTYIAGGNGGSLRTSTDAIVWTLRTANVSTNRIYALTYGNNTYVAGADQGRLSTSPDAIVWTLRTSGFIVGNRIYALTFGNNTYVVGGQAGILNTSTDAITWTLRTSGFAANTIFALTFANNTFVGSASNGVLNTSTDAITWTLRTSGFTAISQLYALTFGNNTYVVGGSGGSIATSSSSASSPTYSTTNLGYFSFNGVDQYATYSSAPLNVNSYTKSVWFRLSSLSTNNNLISASPGHFMYFAGTNKLYCGHSDWGDYAAYPSTTTFSTGVWYNACLTFNTTDGMVLYVNGVQDSTYTTVKTPAAGSGIEIASFGAGNFLTGDVSQVFVYNKSLTAAEVQQNFNATRGRYGI